MKVRFMCMMHECDLYRDENNLLTPERLSDVLNGVGVGSFADRETGYYLFDLSACGCSEDTGNQLLNEDDTEATPSQCDHTWKVVIYSE